MRRAAVAVLVVVAACASSKQPHVEPGTAPEEPVATPSGAVAYDADHAAAVRALVQEFRARNLRIYMPKQGDVSSFGAGVDYGTQPIVEGAEQEGGQPILIPAVPNADGQYEQPVTGTEQGAMVRKTLYTATIDSTRIHIVKTIAQPDTPARVQVPVEIELLRAIAADLPGGFVEREP